MRHPRSRWIRALLLALGVVLTSPLWLLEGAYQWGRRTVDPLPQPEPRPLLPVDRALWVMLEGPVPRRLAPVYPWTVIRLALWPRESRSSGLGLASLASQRWAQTHSGRQRTLERLIVTVALTRTADADSLLPWVADRLFLGRGSDGIQSAARAYFGVSAAELKPEQYAFLAGLVQSPSRYDPDCRPEAALRRRNDVLRELNRAHLISDESLGTASLTPLGVIPRPCHRRPAPPPVERPAPVE